jgi:hypothetical protein
MVVPEAGAWGFFGGGGGGCCERVAIAIREPRLQRGDDGRDS